MSVGARKSVEGHAGTPDGAHAHYFDDVTTVIQRFVQRQGAYGFGRE